MAAAADKPDDVVINVDALLERYLVLLDEYTTLRASLAQLQAGVHQDVARANFGADRGVRYGQDCYGAREGMRALRRVEIKISNGDRDVADFRVVKAAEEEKEDETEKESGAGKEKTEEPAHEKKKQKKTVQQNPLQWFGLMAPQSLRSAQEKAVEVVEKVVPRLAAVNAEMLDIEIEIGRARKRRAKAQAAAARKKSSTGTEASPSRPPIEAS